MIVKVGSAVLMSPSTSTRLTHIAGVAEAGSILLSSGGVLRVPFMQCLKPSALSVLTDCLTERRVQLQTEDATELDPKRRRVETALSVQPTIWATAPQDAIGGESARGAGERTVVVTMVMTVTYYVFCARNNAFPSSFHRMRPYDDRISCYESAN